MKIGQKFRDRIEESIHLHERLLVVLSDASINSAWVEREVVSALERETREKRQVLFPVRIDDAIERSTKSWAAGIRRQYHIGDFSNWKDHDSYQIAFAKVIRDLEASKPASAGA